MRIQQVFVILALWAPSFWAWSINSDCIQTKVLSGDSCRNLHVQFNTSKCGDEARPVRWAGSRCVNNKAVAFVKNKKQDTLFIATYAAPAAGSSAWRLLSVRQQPLSVAPAADSPAAAVVVTSGTDMAIAIKPSEAIAPRGVVSEDISMTPDTPPPPAAVMEPDLTAVVAMPTPIAAVTPAPPPQPTPPVVAAAIAPTPTPTPTPPVEPAVRMTGFVDAYYMQSGNQPTAATSASGTTPPPANVPYRAYDIYSDSFSLALAELSLKKDFADSGGYVDLGFGNMAYQMSPGDLASQYVLQAVAYAKLTDEWTVRVGKMFVNDTLESTYAIQNFNYSHSLLFTFAVPVWQTGAELEYRPSKDFAWSFQAANSWNGLYQNGQKFAGSHLMWHVIDGVTLNYQLLIGTQPTGQGSLRQMHEANALWSWNKQVAFGLDYVWGYQTSAYVGQDATWSSTVASAKFSWGRYTLSPRLELFSDPQGYAISGLLGSNMLPSLTPQTLTSATLSNWWQFRGGSRAVLEFRYDSSDQNVFTDSNGIPTGSQWTSTVALMYPF